MKQHHNTSFLMGFGFGVVAILGTFLRGQTAVPALLVQSDVTTVERNPFASCAGENLEACLLAGCEGVVDIPKAECEALVSLYTSTKGSAWSNHTNRLQTTKACTWNGVGCLNNHVVRLLLQNNNLVGTLPASLSALTELNKCNMSNNSLRGNLPPERSSWTKIVWFMVNDNYLSGPLPTTYSSWKSVKRLWLFDNDFVGTLPASWGAMTSMYDLLISDSDLVGRIPNEWASLTLLENFRLDGNQLTGPIPGRLTKMTRMKDLSLKHNRFCGHLPVAFMQAWPNGIPFAYTRNDNMLIPKGSSKLMQAWITKNSIEFGVQASQDCPADKQEFPPNAS